MGKVKRKPSHLKKMLQNVESSQSFLAAAVMLMFCWERYEVGHGEEVHKWVSRRNVNRSDIEKERSDLTGRGSLPSRGVGGGDAEWLKFSGTCSAKKHD